MSVARRLEDLASWYRDRAERTAEPRIWYMRTRTAEKLDAEAREQKIREMAYVIWEREGRPQGRELDHWRQAEAEIAAPKSAGVADDGKIFGASPEEPAIELPRPH
jgi:hypothetical protein